MKTRKRIAVLGAGKIGQTLVAGILDAGVAPRDHVMVVTKHEETLDAVTKRFKVRGTLSCAEACEFADVVLISVKPQSIREVLAEIKGDDRLKCIPVVILTSSKSEEDILKTYNLNANCYITQPVDLDQFIKVVKSIEEFWFTIVTLPPGQ